MASRVAMVRMSAQETWLVHCGTASTAALAWMTVSKPSPARERLMGLSFSAVLVPVDTRITDASHPCESHGHMGGHSKSTASAYIHTSRHTRIEFARTRRLRW
jgi:hypothetical protein